MSVNNVALANAVNAAGAGAAAAAAPEKKVWKKEPLFRIPSELGMALETYTEHGTRNKYNKHAVTFQCEAVLGPVKGTPRTCWLCGFPIQHLTLLRDKMNKPVFSIKSPMLDKATCDHVLPVKLAHAILELLYITEDPTNSALLHTEYEYAHNFCNIYKSDEYFVSLPLGSRNLCSLEIKHDILNQILRRIFYKQRGDPNSSQYSGVKTVYKGQEITFPNIVQAYCFTSDPEAFLEDPNRFFRQRWFPSAKEMITRKIENLIRYVKATDGCAKEEPGLFFKNIPTRLLEGRVNLPKGFKGPAIHRLKGAPARRVAGIQRSPSFENILAATPIEKRIIAFSAEPYNEYTVDVRKIGQNSISNANLIDKKPRTRKKSNKSVLESPAAVQAENAMAAFAAAGAGAGPVVAEARGNFVEAVAMELNADRLAAAALPEPLVENAPVVHAPNGNEGLFFGGRRHRKTRRVRKH
jgi:hypothetical protein